MSLRTPCHPWTSRGAVAALTLATVAILTGAVTACGGSTQGTGGPGIPPEAMADAIHHVLESDRTVYARHVVNRLQDEEGVIAASEQWEEDRALPLPAQMFRMSAQLTAEKTDRVSYALLSPWPINSRNAPRTEVEEAGLESVAADPSKPFYGTETLGDTEYFTAIYADIAVSPACVTCHNAHADSPRDDFELGDTMGGVVIRIPLD